MGLGQNLQRSEHAENFRYGQVSREHVSHADIVRFADEHVNLKREDAKSIRDQVWQLRDKLEEYIKINPNFELRKMMLSGSLAKGTALKDINDVDVACYISSSVAPQSIADLISWLCERLSIALPGITAKPNEFSVTVTLPTGLRIDVVPILYEEDPDWKGHLISRRNGEKILTSIPMHLKFIRKRKDDNPVHYAQLVRLLKHWVKTRKLENERFRFKSFMVELVLAKLADDGLDLSDYPTALKHFLTFILRDEFRTTFVFSDYYDPSRCKVVPNPIRIWDPVNWENNVAKLYTPEQKEVIVEEAMDAGDAIIAAGRAITKSETVRFWQKVFGPEFEA